MKQTLDNVKNYQRTVLEFNVKLKAKRDEVCHGLNKFDLITVHFCT